MQMLSPIILNLFKSGIDIGYILATLVLFKFQKETNLNQSWIDTETFVNKICGQKKINNENLYEVFLNLKVLIKRLQTQPEFFDKLKQFIQNRDAMIEVFTKPTNTIQDLVITYEKDKHFSVGGVLASPLNSDNKLKSPQEIDELRIKVCENASQVFKANPQYWNVLLNLETAKKTLKNPQLLNFSLTPNRLPLAYRDKDSGPLAVILQNDYNKFGINHDLINEQNLKKLEIQWNKPGLQKVCWSISKVEAILKIKINFESTTLGFVPNQAMNAVDVGGLLNVCMFFKSSGVEALRKALSKEYDRDTRRDIKITFGCLTGQTNKGFENCMIYKIGQMYVPNEIHNKGFYKNDKSPWVWPSLVLVCNQFHSGNDKIKQCLYRQIFQDILQD